MTMECLELVAPTESLREAFSDLVADYERAGEMGFVERHRKWLDDFHGFVRHCRDNAHGLNLPPGYAPGSSYWLVRDGRILGACNLRHRLTEALRDIGGHIGYTVRPSERNKGYATQMLKLCLTKARQMGIDRLLVTCDKDNIASARVIQKNGGVLDSEGINPDNGKPTQRYWINLKPVTLADVLSGREVIIFDLFHTLTALERTWNNSGPTTSGMLGIDREVWEEQLHKCSRDRLTGAKTDPVAIVSDMAHAIDPTIPMEAIRVATENRIARFAAALVQMPQESRDVLAELKRRGKRIGLISNADVMEVAAWKQCPVCDLFEATVFSCQVGCCKPEPEIYWLALRQLGVEPAEAIFVGDGGSDELRGARELGITTVMITGIIRELWPDKIPARQRDADFVIERLSELTQPRPGTGATSD